MGKKQHQKDKLYLTTKEWTEQYGGHKQTKKTSEERLAFGNCALSLVPWKTPLCDQEGHIYDLMAIVPFLRKYKVNPVTGKPLSFKQLTRLNFQKGASGAYHCPVLYKAFANHSHIVAIKTTGNVFSYEAVQQLNWKTGNLKDLLTDEPFTKSDIITLQDPANPEKFFLKGFHHIKNNLRVSDDDGQGSSTLNKVGKATQEILATLEKEYKPSPILSSMTKEAADLKRLDERKKLDHLNRATVSTGRMGAAFTSTALEPVYEQEAAMLDESVVLYARIKKKGYLRLLTSHGPLNLELYCDQVKKTCHNFLTLCKRGYYNNSTFHRSIKNFMIQGGDPTGTGTGGESMFGPGKPIEDEIKPNLSHKGRGILSMANTGKKDSNTSQFFITYRSCTQLDGKHTIFGRVVGGMETLTEMEKVPTDSNDKPTTEIKILRTQIFVDPFQEAEDAVKDHPQIILKFSCYKTNTRLFVIHSFQIASDRTAKQDAEEAAAEAKKNKKISTEKKKKFREGIGKYIDPDALKISPSDEADRSGPAQKKKKVATGFGDFSSWNVLNRASGRAEWEESHQPPMLRGSSVERDSIAERLAVCIEGRYEFSSTTKGELPVEGRLEGGIRLLSNSQKVLTGEEEQEGSRGSSSWKKRTRKGKKESDCDDSSDSDPEQEKRLREAAVTVDWVVQKKGVYGV
ncbi:unnamed protein product [Cyprideis torosa]|uniref:RING-type E3 ubiquitin-protein ligase PPIL2 n=1 Tax=Cyprideis torosa TaxID=163714 RepID=A0A7R8ZLN8_9CRUS|nr:unnamed protein product [Cyprideis torosa]CAG0882626.1 unnamed protein product [Cyprideis torosa]